MNDFSRAACFRFESHEYDPTTGKATLVYRFEHGEPLLETIHFPYAPWPEDARRQAAFRRALALLHLIAGVSYYKAALPAEIDPGDQVLDARLAGFLTRTWTEGLAEFAYRNQIDLAGHIQFPVSEGSDDEAPRAAPLADPLELPSRALVAMGGGKDSLVSLELLRSAGVEVLPATVGDSALIGDTVRAARLPLLRIGRKLDPRLSAMNAAGAWNGHVPVTAINMAILSCAAVLYGYRWVVFSNERSAEQATIHDAAGRPVNHQYSKSLAHERRFLSELHGRVAPDLDVFSLLRPLSEAAVARRFARLERYHPVFSSCNRNFHLDGSRVEGRWCGDCPKCRFTSLALAPWLEPAQLTAIVGVNLLDQPSQEAGFRALCGLGEDKPFECVGTVEESRAMLSALTANPQWKDFAVIKALAPELSESTCPTLEEVLLPAGEHEIPDELVQRVDF